ncbi:uncharacterized protein METZ01_LOCUS210675 [marine metagenome]|uniref:Uncharacterized protein n=1 Tax=marine metagenome TaxID=408172 RepID=A0A382F6T3_9ZZZZ
MAINSEIADGLTELEADFPATFVWNSTSLCVFSLRADPEYQEQGVVEKKSRSSPYRKEARAALLRCCIGAN